MMGTYDVNLLLIQLHIFYFSLIFIHHEQMKIRLSIFILIRLIFLLLFDLSYNMSRTF